MLIQCRTYCLVTTAALLVAHSSLTPAQGKQISSGLPSCPTTQVDTSGWELSTNFELGIEFARPKAYAAKVWGSSRLPGDEISADWWRNGPGWTIEITKRPVVPDSTPHRTAAANNESVHTCALESRAGRAIAALIHEPRGSPPGKFDSLYVTIVTYPPHAGHVIRFIGNSLDLAGQLEQVMISRTLRFVAVP